MPPYKVQTAKSDGQSFEKTGPGWPLKLYLQVLLQINILPQTCQSTHSFINYAMHSFSSMLLAVAFDILRIHTHTQIHSFILKAQFESLKDSLWTNE